VNHFDYANAAKGEPILESLPSYGSSNLSYVLSIAKRRKLLLFLGLIAAIAGGSLYYLYAKPKYTATTFLYVDVIRTGSDSSSSSSGVDSGEIDSQVEVIQSRQVVETMVRSLGAPDRQRLAQAFGNPSYLPLILARFPILETWAPSLASPPDPGGFEDGIDIEKLTKALTVTRVERTYVLSVSFAAPSATLAADVSNAFVNAYRKVTDDRRLAAEQAHRDWLNRRIQEAQALLLQADKDLQSFRLSPVVGESDAVKRQLELKTETYRNLYQSLLQQSGAPDPSIAQTGFHVITAADASAAVRSPRLSLVAALSLLFGVGAGAVAAALYEAGDRSFRTRGQVETFLGARFLGWLPIIGETKASRSGKSSGLDPPALGLPDVFRVSTDNPRSRYAETLREVMACASLLPPKTEPKVVGVVSAWPGEGKSTVAVNLAQSLARDGLRTLLIDGDLGNRGLTRILAPSARCGLYDLLGDGPGRAGLEDVVVADDASGLSFLPVAEAKPQFRSGGHPSIRFGALVTEAKGRFDVVVIDLPPFAVVAKARFWAASADCFVLVCEWGRTHRGAVWRFLDSERQIRNRLLGVVLNKVDLRKLRQYEQRDEPQHYPYSEYFGDSGS